MRNVETGFNPAESNEVQNLEGLKNFVEGLKTSNYTEEQLVNIKSVLGEISKGL